MNLVSAILGGSLFAAVVIVIFNNIGQAFALFGRVLNPSEASLLLADAFLLAVMHTACRAFSPKPL